MLSAEIIRCLQIFMSMTNFGLQANSADSDQTPPRGAV